MFKWKLFSKNPLFFIILSFIVSMPPPAHFSLEICSRALLLVSLHCDSSNHGSLERLWPFGIMTKLQYIYIYIYRHERWRASLSRKNQGDWLYLGQTVRITDEYRHARYKFINCRTCENWFEIEWVTAALSYDTSYKIGIISFSIISCWLLHHSSSCPQ